MQKLLIICGPTATGKTELAIKLAKKFNGELISADSRQVYKGMDIGTGKDLPICHSGDERSKDSRIYLNSKEYLPGYFLKVNIPLWLLDIVRPDEDFSVADYEKLAWITIKDIWKRGKLPVIVGGTGLYIKAVIDGIGTIGIPQDKKLRRELDKIPLEKLQQKLQKLNSEKWETMNISDRNNPRRLVRAIEISRFDKSNFSNVTNLSKSKSRNFQTLMIGLTASKETLYERIDNRVEKRVKEGIIEEIKLLLKKGYGWNLPSMSGMGYRVWKDYFEGKKFFAETVERWKLDEHNYAKRQLTWFKKDKRIRWFDINNLVITTKVISAVTTFING